MGGYVVAVFANDRITAAAAIRRALMLNQNSAHAWNANGWVLCFGGEADAAIDAFQHAMRLSPLDPLGYMFSGGLAFAHLAAGRYEQAVEWADRSLREQPRYSIAIRAKVVSLAQLDRLSEARRWLERLLELQPGLTVTNWKASYGAPFLSPELLEVYIEGLRKGGLPES